MITIMTIKDVNLKDKRVLVRVDFNVPLSLTGEIMDDKRIRASLPTINYILEKQGKVILMSHLGRPDGFCEKYSLRIVGKHLQDLLGQPVKMLSDCIGPEVEEAVRTMKRGEIILLENLRFHKEEEKNAPEFARKLALLGDIYVNDAFGSSHRSHASISGVPKYLHPAVAGFLLEKEQEYLGRVLSNPKRPFATIIGGAKVSDKIVFIENILGKVDMLLLGGGMAYTFLKAKGYKIGNSKLESEKLFFAKDILDKAEKKGVKIVLPLDNVIAEKIEEGAKTRVVEGSIPDGWIGVDIGPLTCEKFEKNLSQAKTILWNGPVGIFEIPAFANGTKNIANFIGKTNAITVVGGGDTASAAEKFGISSLVSHVSTGGGASLEFLEGRKLPGIEALDKKEQ